MIYPTSPTPRRVQPKSPGSEIAQSVVALLRSSDPMMCFLRLPLRLKYQNPLPVGYNPRVSSPQIPSNQYGLFGKKSWGLVWPETTNYIFKLRVKLIRWFEEAIGSNESTVHYAQSSRSYGINFPVGLNRSRN